ncbi:hypothetical protein G7Z17_g1642 [Cylindrodendrum hubeiense]|uniref:Uncharacterized protein n=1 Tax=Cylindrodendrum hubeiense TaxID=595255 RepID=A0A9P5HFT4_9HYPO|nr:hypothetical protein G7Z17_g1642 [Cylindrodendrum hubeiense]
MVAFPSKAIGGVIAAYLLAQQCQCPPLAIPLITSAALQVAAAVGSAGASFAGAIVGAHFSKKSIIIDRRQAFVAPAGVPQQEFDRCYNDLAQESVAITVNGPVSNNGIQVDGLPASCMNLATVLDGDAVGGPVPIPCGSACILYDNMSEADYSTMQTTFEGLKNA